MKLMLVLVTIAGLGAVVGAVAVGVATRDEVVSEHPYEDGLKFDAQRKAAAALAPTCALDHGPCAQPGPLDVTLAASPRPVRTMAPLDLVVTLASQGAPVDGAEVRLDLTMPGMFMGQNRVALAGQGGGRYTGRGTIVRCPSGGKLWQAEVTARPAGGEPTTARFLFLTDQP